jgi:hypothetical protein
VDISFYDWHYSGVYLQTPMIPTDTHSRVIGITLPQSTFAPSTGFEPVTYPLTAECSKPTELRRNFCTDRRTRTSTNSFGDWDATITPYPCVEVPSGFEPPNKSFADSPLKPLGYRTLFICRFTRTRTWTDCLEGSSYIPLTMNPWCPRQDSNL